MADRRALCTTDLMCHGSMFCIADLHHTHCSQAADVAMRVSSAAMHSAMRQPPTIYPADNAQKHCDPEHR